MQHVNHLLAAYYDEELEPGRRRQVEQHLRECPACQAELERLSQLSDLLAQYTLPKSLTSPKIFQSQVMLRLSRRQETRMQYQSWVWYVIPLGLSGVLVLLQALFAIWGLFTNLLSWQSLDWLALLGIDWSEFVHWGTTWSSWLASSWVHLVGLVSKLVLYLLLILVFIPFAGWVTMLLRSVRNHHT